MIFDAHEKFDFLNDTCYLDKPKACHSIFLLFVSLLVCVRSLEKYREKTNSPIFSSAVPFFSQLNAVYLSYGPRK